MATEVIKVIDPDSGTGFDYTSLSSWDSGENTNLVTADEQATAKCRCTGGTADTTSVTLSLGWTTDATRYIKIWTDPAESYRHDGTYPTGNKYRLENSGGTRCINVPTLGAGHVKIIGLALKMYNTSGSCGVYAAGASGWIYVEQCVIMAVLTSGAANFYGIHCTIAGNKKYISNNILYDIVNGPKVGAGIRCDDASTQGQYIYNNTTQNCRVGYYTVSGECIFKNCIAQDCTSEGFVTDGGFHTDCTNNCSDFTSDAPGSNPRTGEVLFANEGSDDFHLSASDTIAKDYGATLSSDTYYPITVDIDGDTRSPSWDIGADEVAGIIHNAVATVVGKGLKVAAAVLILATSATASGSGEIGSIVGSVDRNCVATVTGSGLLGDIVPDLTLGGKATVTGSGELGPIVPDLTLGGAATVTGYGLLGDVIPVLDLGGVATVTGYGLLGDIIGTTGTTHLGVATVFGAGLLGPIVPDLTLGGKATVTGYGLLGDIVPSLTYVGVATVTGSGLLGDVIPDLTLGGIATATGAGLLGDVVPVLIIVDSATVVGAGLLGDVIGTVTGLLLWSETINIDSMITREVNVDSVITKEVNIDSMITKQVDLDSEIGLEEV